MHKRTKYFDSSKKKIFGYLWLLPGFCTRKQIQLKCESTSQASHSEWGKNSLNNKLNVKCIYDLHRIVRLVMCRIPHTSWLLFFIFRFSCSRLKMNFPCSLILHQFCFALLLFHASQSVSQSWLKANVTHWIPPNLHKKNITVC